MKLVIAIFEQKFGKLEFIIFSNDHKAMLNHECVIWELHIMYYRKCHYSCMFGYIVCRQEGAYWQGAALLNS